MKKSDLSLFFSCFTNRLWSWKTSKFWYLLHFEPKTTKYIIKQFDWTTMEAGNKFGHVLPNLFSLPSAICKPKKSIICKQAKCSILGATHNHLHWTLFSIAWILPVSPAWSCMAWIQGVTPSRTYMRLLLFGQNLNWNCHSLPLASCTVNGSPSGCEIAGKYAWDNSYVINKTVPF